VDFEAKYCFASRYIAQPLPQQDLQIDDIAVKKTFLGGVKKKAITRGFQRSSPENAQKRRSVRIGIPRVLNLWSTGPFFRAYFEALGMDPTNVVFSDETSEEMWQEGGKYGSIDPCFPAKVAQAHVHNLLFKKHKRCKLDFIFFPCLTHIPSFVEYT